MHYTALPSLQHELVTLRPLRPGDIEPWFTYLSVPEVYEHTSWNVQSAAELAHYAWREEDFTPSSLLRFAIALRASDRLVGTAGFHSVSPHNATAELAYDLDPAYWGKGIATAACAELVDWAHCAAAVNRVQATVLDTNTRSGRVLERCGFQREGLLRAYRLVRGRPGDFHMYAHVQLGTAV
jgi:ribosomal-protein-alanine N-acetyltransferase